ncbi:MAG: LysM peptidoglycan-binding domain-containing protein [Acidobacteria bacterium]|nr:LysM peptidoglycan-binding domain-containing protein [Acidobacteriota bacterium]
MPIGGFIPITYKNEGFMTLGAFNVDGYVTFQANDLLDVMSVQAKIDTAPSWTIGFQDHKASKDGVAFAANLVRHSRIYKHNSRIEPFPFELLGADCAPWIRTLLRVCGISSEECHRIGRLNTYPANQRLSFPQDMFLREIPPKQPTNPSQPGGQRIHTVESGDWLSKIAIRYYGDMNKWTVIYDANKGQIGMDPNRIEVGQRLVIP